MRTRRTQVILMGSCLFLFAALRSYEVGTDLPGYFRFYGEDGEMDFIDIMLVRSTRDPFFHAFLHVLYQISHNPQLMLVAIGAFVAATFSFMAYREKGNVLLIYILFIGLRMYSFTLSGLRQAMALGVIFVAYVMLREKKYIRYVVLVILASLFHKSALIFLLAYPIIKYKNTSSFIIGALSVCAINLATGGALALLIKGAAFEERFEGYSMDQAFHGGFTFIVYLLLFIYALVRYKDMKRIDNTYPESLRILTMGFALAFIGQTVENVFRMAYYFNFVNFMMVPVLLSASASSKTEKNAIQFLVAIVFSLQYLILGQGAEIEEYSFFWEVPYIY